jgi:hypothetical protein
MAKPKVMEGWRIQCRDCSYSDRFGALKFSAEQACVRHWNRMHHAIGLYEVTLDHMFGELEGQYSLLPEDPPF